MHIHRLPTNSPRSGISIVVVAALVALVVATLATLGTVMLLAKTQPQALPPQHQSRLMPSLLGWLDKTHGVIIMAFPSDQFLQRLTAFEGYRPQPYLCPTGWVSIGYGTNLQAHPEYLPEGVKPADTPEKLLARLHDARMTWSESAARAVLSCEIKYLSAKLEQRCYAYNELLRAGEIARAEVLLDMCYNLGFRGLMQFQRMFARIHEAVKDPTPERWERVAQEMQDSRWYHQVPGRASALVQAMLVGKYNNQEGDEDDGQPESV